MSEAVKDLGAFLSRLTDDTARLSFADRLDEVWPEEFNATTHSSNPRVARVLTWRLRV